ncbi:uncharacterized protein LOC106662630 [Cimex lectularius]|uniref:Uncharacterized protein n=1 Tax=Cimex lectularius TaxID=79782 RepID=A0A8I6REJ3_CIMLE|nr:uncharacterized protein LOC106662630 [Cimex lectularius]
MKKTSLDQTTRSSQLSGIRKNTTFDEKIGKKSDDSKQESVHIKTELASKSSNTTTVDKQIQTVSPSFTKQNRLIPKVTDIEKLIPLIVNTCKNCGYKNDKSETKLQGETLGAIFAKCREELLGQNPALDSVDFCPDIPKNSTKPISIVQYDNTDSSKPLTFPTATAASVLYEDEGEKKAVTQESEHSNNAASSENDTTSETLSTEKKKQSDPDTQKSESQVTSPLVKTDETPKSPSKSTISSTKSKKSIFNRKTSITTKNKKVYKSYGKYIAEELRSMPPEKAVVCQRLINETLTHGLMGQLNNTSRVTSKK